MRYVITRLTMTPHMNTSHLSPKEREVAQKAQDVLIESTVYAQELFNNDDIEGVDLLDHEKGSVHIKNDYPRRSEEAHLVMKDPGQQYREFRDIKELSIQKTRTRTGESSSIALKGDASFENQEGKGFLITCTEIDHEGNKNSLTVFGNERTHTLTVIEGTV